MKPASTPKKANVDLWCDDTHLLNDPGQYKKLIGKLIYLRITKPNIIFTVGVLSRLMRQPREVHWTFALRIFAYVKSSPGKDLLYKKYWHVCIFDYFDSGYTVDKED